MHGFPKSNSHVYCKYAICDEIFFVPDIKKNYHCLNVSKQNPKKYIKINKNTSAKKIFPH